MSTNSGSSSLRPAWKGGRGFQPPPTVTSDHRETSTSNARGRSSSISSGDREKRSSDSNKFSALQDDDDFISVGGKKNRDRDNNNNSEPKENKRSEAFRSSFQGRASKPGRSLADLAKSVPEVHRSASTGSAFPPAAAATTGGSGPGGRRFSDLAGRGGSGDPAQDALEGRSSGAPRPAATNEVSAYRLAVDAADVIRFTREKLLSMRPRPDMNTPFPPPHLAHVEATILLSEKPQDPACFDTFDADAIWAAVPLRRTSAPLAKGPPARGPPDPDAPPGERRRSYNTPSQGRWQRGQALPPSDEKRAKEKDANHPNELWDDPVAGPTGAAMDFSAFGAMPSDSDFPKGSGHGSGSVGSAEAFDFEKMAEATRRFEEELHGSKGSNDAGTDNGEEDEEEVARQVVVNPKRPLAAGGMVVRSGSGDDVNVFEDFDAPAEDDGLGEQPATGSPEKPAMTAEEEASSRLMAMIGVKKEGDPAAAKGDGDLQGLLGLAGPASASTAIPLNPWGGPMLPAGGQPAQQNVGLGMDLASRLESFAAEQKARESAEMQQKELLRRRQEQEEAQRRAVVQQQEQERVRQQAQQQQAMQQQQPPSAQSQVELVLMERITTILENSWGRSDLMSILSTLHAEDSRVIPLLGNVDLLRDLIAHNPRRVALRHDPAFGTEMAILSMTNAQFQQHEAQVRAQQEELRRREEQIRLENIQRQRSMSSDGPPRVNPDAPWFYSDPQQNIQGPFRGDEMRQWLEAGYFKGDLPISQQAGGPFIALSAIFRDLSMAFVPQPDDRAEDEARARAAEERRQEERMMEERRMEEQRLEERRMEEQRAAEEQRRAEEEYQRQRQAEDLVRQEQEAREAAERERQAAEAGEASNGGNQSSAQLKMMLGLQSGENAAEEQPQSEPKSADEKRPSKANNKNNNNQKQPKEQAPVQQAPAPAAKPAAPAWGGAAQKAPTNTKKSMSEIQKEEARRAAALAMQQGNQPSRQSSSGWANVAATGTGAWTPGTVKPTSAAAVVAGGAAVAPGGRPMGAQPGAAGRPKGAAATGVRNPGAPQQRNSNSSNTAAEEFGASMSPAFEKWCKDQMVKLNGSDDLTLVSFCMTLNDPTEIRQYLTTYLGGTAQVNNFATEFINKKGGTPAPQEEWETPGSAKKGRKKKGAK